jgi:hypothetical protein
MIETSQLVLSEMIDLQALANISVGAERFAYEKGFEHGRQSIRDDFGAECETWIDAAKLAAELYQKIVLEKLPEVGEFDSVRVGFNFTMGGPGVLAILPASKSDKLIELRAFARALEAAVLEHTSVDLFICTIATDAPDRERIAHDFPIYRTTWDG